jgi:general secretion pathway protein F
LFESAQKALPFGATLLLGLSDFLVSYWWMIVLGLAGSVLVLPRLSRNVVLAGRIDQQLLRTPFIGPLLAQIEAEKFCRVLSALLGNGVSLPVSLNLTKDVLRSPVFRQIAGEAALKVREGKALSILLANARHFPNGTVDFLRIGEESGDVPGALARQADLLAVNTKATIDRTLAMVVPVITIALGLVVGAIIATLLTAILSINELAI